MAGKEGRPLYLTMLQTEKWEGESENIELVWVVFRAQNILFRATLFTFTLIGAERARAFLLLLLLLFFTSFLQHLTCHLMYILEMTNSAEKERTQGVGERSEKQYNLLTIYEH